MKSALPFVLLMFFLPLHSQTISIQVDQPYLRTPIDHHGKIQQLELCGLKKGKSYTLIASDKQRNCTHKISIENPTKSRQTSPTQTYFIATESCQKVRFEPGCLSHEAASLSVYCEDCEGTRYEKIMAGITTANNSNAQNLIQDVFIGGGCFEVAGAFKRGATGQIGTFSNGTSSIGIEDGIILSTGNIASSAGPNQFPNTGTDYGIFSNDPDLTELTGGTSSMFDVASIEFDFTPTVNQISFQYVFASEEYCEWVGSQYNDVFGFFIRGPGINGDFFLNADNIAVLPGNGDYVAINSVNSSSNQGFYHDNSPNTTACSTGEQFALGTIAYDGFTTVLTAVANVIPCQTYHIKLAIGDRGDGAFDSAVFLQANSFAAGSTTNMTATILGPSVSQTTAYESCGSAVVTFERFTNDLSEDFVVNFSLSPSSTATPGVDYSAFPTTIVIPAGQSSVSIPIEIFGDLIIEGIETIILELQGACTCESNSLIIEIIDPPPIDLYMADILVCENQSTTISPSVSGGTPGYTYQWSNGGTDASLQVDIGTEPQPYSLTVTDVCGQVQASGLVVYPNAPAAELSGTDSICQGNFEAALQVEFSGIGPFDLTYSVSGFVTTITNIYANPFMLPADLPGTYQLVNVSASGCPGEVSGLGEVGIAEVVVDVDANPVSCYGEADGEILLAPTGGTAPYSFNWNQGLPNADTISALGPGNYAVTITDATGCVANTTATIEEPEEMVVSLIAVEDIDCTNADGGEIAIAVSGGSGGYTFNWSDGSVDSVLTNAGAGNYTLLVTDASGCQAELAATIEDFIDYPTAVANVSGVINCLQSEVLLDPEGSSIGNEFSYEWLDESGSLLSSSQDALSQDQPGDYSLIITNQQNHCRDTAQLTVLLDIIPPIAEAGVSDTLTCTQSSFQLDGSQSSTGNHFVYSWTTEGGHFVDTPNEMSPTIDGPGLYILQLTNNINGCVDLDSVTIAENTVSPFVEIAPPGIINCYTPQLTLDGSHSDTGTNYTYAWSSDDGTFLSTTDSTSVDIADGGLYTFMVTDLTNGCMTSMEINVPENLEVPLADPGLSQELDCETSTAMLDGNGSSTGGDITYLWQTENGFIIGDSTTLNLTVGEAGDYQLIVTNVENGCTAENIVSVMENSNAPIVQAQVHGILTCDQNQITIDAIGSDSGSQFEIQWTGNNGQEIVNPSSLTPTVNEPGVYTLSIFNVDNSCLSTLSLPVSQNIVAPTIDVGPDGLINCYEPIFNLEGSITDAGPDYQINWISPIGIIPGANGLSQLVDTPGTYLFSVQNNVNGCLSQDSITVAADQIPPNITAGPDMVLNCATPSLNLQGNLLHSLPNFELVWQLPDGMVLPEEDIFNPTIEEPGQYQLTVTNLENGCSSQDEVLIAANFAYPEADAGSQMTLNCDDTTLTINGLNSSQGNLYSYNWTTSDGHLLADNTTLQPQVDAPGNYQLIVTNTESFCRDTASVSILQDIQSPIVNIALPEELTCERTTIQLDASGSSNGPQFEYTWSSPDGHIISGGNNITSLVDEPGMYQLLVYNQENGCTALAQTQVTRDPNIPVADAGLPLTLTCTQTTGMLDGSGSSAGANVIYNWESLDGNMLSDPNQLSIMVDHPGLFVLHVTNLDNNCIDRDTIPVSIDTLAPLAIANVNELLSCSQTTVSLSGAGSSSGAAFSYNWSSPIGNSIQNPSSLEPIISIDGIYHLQVVNENNGCISETEVNVGIDTLAPLITIANPDLLTCSLTSLELSAQTQAAHDFVASWSTTNGSIIEGGNSLTPLIEEPGNYQLLIEDIINGCSTTTSITVDENVTIPDAVAGADNLLTCAVTALQLDGNQSSNGHHTYLWTTTEGNIQSGELGLSPTITAPGSYTLEVTDTENGCQATDVVTINQDVDSPQISLIPPAQLTCLVNAVPLNSQTDETTDAYTFQWYNDSGLPIANATEQNLNVTQAGTYQLVVTNTVNGCSETIQGTVEQNIQPPTAEAGTSGILTCKTTELSLDGGASSSGPGYTYTWQGNGLINGMNSLQPVINQPGMYTLMVTDTGNGCTDEDQVEVIREVPRDASLTIDPGPCVGDFSSIQVETVEGGFGPYTYSIDGGFSFQATPSFPRLEAGLYPVVVRDRNDCDFSMTAHLPEPLDLQINLDPQITIHLGETVNLYAQVNIPESQISSITWIPGDSLSCNDCLNPIARPTHSNSYLVQVISEEGCESTATVALRVDRRPAIYIPNAFSPNNQDGTNDRFYVFAKPGFVKKVNSLMVFNRWGELVYQVYNFPPNDPQFGWDGKHRGQLLNPAVFVYWTEVELIDGTVLLLKGDVTLVN
ncbi:MAG: hypothetical protein DHS20C18_08650 [Saprospiraceae bacterium]|nr:MAG: hypothetical protein DHS20C18_08650 [Saprospiraceae bacterium]